MTQTLDGQQDDVDINPPDEILTQLENDSTDQKLIDAGKGETGVNHNNY